RPARRSSLSAAKSYGASAGSRTNHGREPEGYRAKLAIVAGWIVNAYEGRERRRALQFAQLLHDESEFVRPWKVAQGILTASSHAPERASAILIGSLRGEAAAQARTQRRGHRHRLELGTTRRLPVDGAQPHNRLQREGVVRPRPRGSKHRPACARRRRKSPDRAEALPRLVQGAKGRTGSRDRHCGLTRCQQRS